MGVRGDAVDGVVMAGGTHPKAHFVFVPFMAQGHLIPAVDTALLLATHGALCHPWTRELAGGLGVPRLTFFSMCAFCLLCLHNVERFHAFDAVADDDEPIVVPGLAKRFEVTRAQARGFFRVPTWEEFADEVGRAQAEVDGVVMNTFLEMEPEYVAGYAEARDMKVWTVGAVWLYCWNHRIDQPTST